MQIQLIGLDDQQVSASQEILSLLNIEQSDKGISILVELSESGIHVQFDGNKGSIAYQEPCQLYRALGLLIEGLKKGDVFQIREKPVYNSLGVLIDCSRNAVLKVETFQRLVKHLALMGYSSIQLYTEDTYEIKEYPYFGYMRGRYTGEQLKNMDQYANRFGIELIPCIQTLAHLGTSLKWEAFSDILDCNDILLIDEEKTYDLIDAMFRTMSNNISSRKINIGMDEAHMIGLGKYLDQHGYQDRTTLLLKHFGRLMEIARKYRYEPMMWSDMFFRLASSGEYYDTESPIRQDVIEMIPDDISLVYWDYYSVDPKKYDGMLKKHKQLSSNIIFAAGAWKWTGFSSNNRFSRRAGEIAHKSCIRNEIKDVFITAWGDNGAEASIYSILPTLQFWAELSYTDSADSSRLEERFTACVGANYADFMSLDMTMLVPGNTSPNNHSLNPSKYLLYQDVLCGLFDRHVIPNEYSSHFQRCAEHFQQCMKRNPVWQELFLTQYSLSRVLAVKCDAGMNIRQAYHTKNRETLALYCYSLLPEMKNLVEEFMTAYRSQWMEENKIFGLDVFDLRMGGLLQRIQTAIDRIDDYLKGNINELEELEEEVLYFDGREKDGETKAISANLWHTIATPSVIAGI